MEVQNTFADENIQSVQKTSYPDPQQFFDEDDNEIKQEDNNTLIEEFNFEYNDMDENTIISPTKFSIKDENDENDETRQTLGPNIA